MYRSAGPGSRVACLFLASTLMIAGAGATAGEVTFSTTGGGRIIGEVVSATVNMLNVRKSDGGYDMVPRRKIESVGMETDAGAIEGSFINWQDDRFTLRIDDRVVSIRDGILEGDADDIVQPAALEQPSETPAPTQQLEAADIIEETAPGDEPIIPPSEPIENPTM